MRTTVLLALLTLALPLTHADTLQFIGPGSNSTNGVYTYPYHFLVDGQPADLMCLSFDNEIVDGESWQATAAVPTTVPEREAAWLLNDTQTHPADASADNLAAWGLFSGVRPLCWKLGLSRLCSSQAVGWRCYRLRQVWCNDLGRRVTWVGLRG